MLREHVYCLTGLVFLPLLLSACGSSSDGELIGELEQSLGSGLVITEVAQSTSYAGTTADKVEVFCDSASSCASFKVCDSASSGSSCSSAQSALDANQRRVVSRGSSITTSDELWLTDSNGNELSGTRVSPVNCSSGQSKKRKDCSTEVFGSCGAHNLGVSSGACASQPPPPPPAAEAFSYSVKFTTNQHGGPESSCNRPMCQELVGFIDAATTSIDFAIYGVRNQSRVISALAAAQARGVRVRGAVDSENSDCSQFAYPNTVDLIDSLQPGSVVCDTGSGYSYIMHNKFFVFDGRKVWTGSTNISDTELGGEYNTDVAATINSSRFASIYTGEMNEMFAGLFHNRKSDNSLHSLANFTDGTTVIKSHFSPTDNARDNSVIPMIHQATSTLDIAMFFLTSQEIADAVLAAHARGVNVRVVIDAGGAANAYSKIPELCSAGVSVKWENWGGKSHSKWAVADSGISSRAAVVYGSMNWTGAGNSSNDENTVYVKNASFAADFQNEFNRQWSDLANVPVCDRVSAEGADSSSCGSTTDCSTSCASGSCCDGSDNDYDGNYDLDDEACACADGVDNDGDGYVDANDWECRAVTD